MARESYVVSMVVELRLYETIDAVSVEDAEAYVRAAFADTEQLATWRPGGRRLLAVRVDPAHAPAPLGPASAPHGFPDPTARVIYEHNSRLLADDERTPLPSPWTPPDDA